LASAVVFLFEVDPGTGYREDFPGSCHSIVIGKSFQSSEPTGDPQQLRLFSTWREELRIPELETKKT
jgi:hypothetical protein